MTNKKDSPIRELHEKLMNEFLGQIVESISNTEEPFAGKRRDTRSRDLGATAATKKPSAISPEQHGGHEKINAIRNEAAAKQSAKKNRSVEILNPDKQKELMEIVKQKCDQFERELSSTLSGNKSVFELESQKFKDELMKNARKKLTESKYAFTG